MTGIFERFEQAVLDVGLTEAPFPTLNKYGTVRQPEAIFVQSPTTNTQPIVIGKTGTKADLSEGGISLPVGADTILPFFNENILVAISSAAGQKLLVLYLAGALK
jgi:hypothetical protein